MDKQDIKRGIVRAMRGVLTLLPRAVVRSAIHAVPRLAVGAPAGMQFRTNDFLGEFALELDTTSCVERSMIRGTYEPGNLRVLREHVRPGDCCVDVGANAGAMTFAMAQATGRGGRVYAFEPGPPFYQRLVRNVALNPSYADVIVCENVGVSDADGTLRWAEADSDIWRGNGGVVASGGVEVPVVTLDAYAAAHISARIAFIKVDVEGWELHVLRGAQRILREQRPVVMFETLAEFDEQSGGTFYAGISALFRECNYELFGVATSGRTFRTEQLGVTQMMLARPR